MRATCWNPFTTSFHSLVTRSGGNSTLNDAKQFGKFSTSTFMESKRMPSLNLIRYRGKGPVGQKSAHSGQCQDSGARIQEVGGAGRRKARRPKSNHYVSNQWPKVKDSSLDKPGRGPGVFLNQGLLTPGFWLPAPKTDPAGAEF